MAKVKKRREIRMTKTERLIYLINLLNKRKIVKPERIISECGVSRRTVFRDMAMLAELNFPVYYDNGYHLLRKSQFPHRSLSDKEKGLIFYCLGTSHLNQLAKFEKLLGSIEEKLLNSIWRKNDSNTGRIFYGFKPQTFSVMQKASTRHLLSVFMEALISERTINLTKRSNAGYVKAIHPIHVSYINNQITFKFRRGRTKTFLVLNESQIETIEIAT